MTRPSSRSALGWMSEFQLQPLPALDRLLFGRAWVGAQQANDPDEILYRFFHKASPELRQDLDAALRGWFEKHWGTVPVDQSRWCQVLRDAFSAALRLDLEQSLAWLRGACQQAQGRAWLSSLRMGRPRDPEANLLRTLALSQPNCKLLPLWMRLCRMEEERPDYFASLGLMGLYRLPDEDGQPHPDLHSAVFKGIVEMARAFSRRIFPRSEAERLWKNEVWALMARFPRSEHYWIEHLLPQVASAPRSAPAIWLCGILPSLEKALQKKKRTRKPPSVQPPSLRETRTLLRRLGRRPSKQARLEMEGLLDRHRRYAEQSGEGEFLVKTLTNTATKVMDSLPHWARQLAEEAFGWAPGDFFVWAARAQAEANSGHPGQALSLLWEAKRRMPEIADIRTNLAEMLRRCDELPLAEMVYRQAVTDFPDNPVCRNGLAGLLKDSKRYQEAESAYRQAAADFPGNPVSRSGLAEALRAQARWAEAETVCRQAMHDFPDNPYFAVSLAAILQAQGAFGEAEGLLRQAMQDHPSDPACRTGLAVLWLSQEKEEEGLELLRQTARRFPDDPVASGFLRKLEQRRSDFRALVRSYPRFGAKPELETPTVQIGETTYDAESGYGLPSPSPLHNRAAAQTGLAGLCRWAARQTSGRRRKEFLKESKRLSESVLEADPNDLSALLEKGFSLLEAGEAEQAEALLAPRVANGEHRHLLGLQLAYWKALTLQGRPPVGKGWQALEEEFPHRKTLLALARVIQEASGGNGNGSARTVLAKLRRQLRSPLSRLPQSLKENEQWLRSQAEQHLFRQESLKGPLSREQVPLIQENLRSSTAHLQSILEQCVAG